MISYEEYKKLNNIENNQYIGFLDVSSWKENNRKNRPRTTNNSDIQITFPKQKLNFFPKSRKNMQLRCKYLKKVYNIIPSGTIKENWT